MSRPIKKNKSRQPAIFQPPKGCRAPELHNEAREFFLRTWDIFPQDAAEAGLHEFQGRLGSNSPDTHKAYAALLRDTLSKIESLPAINYSGDDWLDYRGFLSYLRTGLFFQSTFPSWQLNPQTHAHTPVNSIFHLLIRNADNLKPVTPAILSLLSETPRFLEEGFRCLRRPVPLWTKLAIHSSKDAAAFLKEITPQFSSRSHSTFAAAVDAYLNYAHKLSQIKTGPTNSFSIGRESFEFLTRERLGMDLSAQEIQSAGRHLVAQISADIHREARKFGRRTPSDIIENARTKWTESVPPLIDEYRRITTDIKRRLASSSIVSLPRNEELRVIPVPDFLRSQFPTAAYSAPGPFDPDQTGIFWVNDLSLAAPTEAARKAEIAQHFGLELTCAHEAYPGHHLQFIIQNRHPSHLRRMFSHAVYYEGWTLWCERMCVDLKLYDAPHARLMQLHDALWRAHRILVDVGLHTGELSYQAAVKHLMDNVGFTRARAAADVNWYTSAPTVPMSYLLGARQVLDLRNQNPSENLREFNNRILSTGSLPWNWLRLA